VSNLQKNLEKFSLCHNVQGLSKHDAQRSVLGEELVFEIRPDLTDAKFYN